MENLEHALASYSSWLPRDKIENRDDHRRAHGSNCHAPGTADGHPVGGSVPNVRLAATWGQNVGRHDVGPHGPWFTEEEIQKICRAVARVRPPGGCDGKRGRETIPAERFSF